jgi:hypothetical protein
LIWYVKLIISDSISSGEQLPGALPAALATEALDGIIRTERKVGLPPMRRVGRLRDQVKRPRINTEARHE